MMRWKEYLFEDKPDWVGPKLARFLLDNPAILLTTTYVLISGLGLLYQYTLFDYFGVNVIDYAKSEDLFLVAFKNPSALFSGAGIALSMVFYKFVATYAKQRKNRFLRIILLTISWIGLLRREILIPIGIFYFVSMYAYTAEFEGGRLINTSDDVVSVILKSNSQAFSLLPIGSTGSFLFGIELDTRLKTARQEGHHSTLNPVIRAIPFSEIARLDYSSRNFFVDGGRFSRPANAIEKVAP